MTVTKSRVKDMISTLQIIDKPDESIENILIHSFNETAEATMKEKSKQISGKSGIIFITMSEAISSLETASIATKTLRNMHA